METLKKYLIFKKMVHFHISGNGNCEKFVIFQETKLSYILGNETFLCFLKKCFSYVSGKVYSERQHRTGSILRILVHSEPEAYSEHFQTSVIERFVKVAI